MVLVMLVSSRETGHLTPESLERRDRFDNNAHACGWDNAGHSKIKSVTGPSLGFGNDAVKYYSVDDVVPQG